MAGNIGKIENLEPQGSQRITEESACNLSQRSAASEVSVAFILKFLRLKAVTNLRLTVSYNTQAARDLASGLQNFR